MARTGFRRSGNRGGGRKPKYEWVGQSIDRIGPPGGGSLFSWLVDPKLLHVVQGSEPTVRRVVGCLTVVGGVAEAQSNYFMGVIALPGDPEDMTRTETVADLAQSTPPDEFPTVLAHPGYPWLWTCAGIVWGDESQPNSHARYEFDVKGMRRLDEMLGLAFIVRSVINAPVITGTFRTLISRS